MGVWTGKGQAGFVSTQGNSESKSGNAALDLSFTDEPWKHAFHLGGLYGENDNVVSAERWDTRWQSNYDFTKAFYGFGALRYAHDLFSGFRYQGSATVGVGYKFIDTTDTKLEAQVGAGYRESRPEQLTKDPSGAVISRTLLPQQNEAIFTAGLDYSQALTSTTTLANKFLVESGSSNTLFTDALTLTVKMAKKLALSLGYSLQDNTNPPVGLKSLDTTETINLVFEF
jgi:putative salt-induced outer membrane protein